MIGEQSNSTLYGAEACLTGETPQLHHSYNLERRLSHFIKNNNVIFNLLRIARNR